MIDEIKNAAKKSAARRDPKTEKAHPFSDDLSDPT
jgi:hypothetical protein